MKDISRYPDTGKLIKKIAKRFKLRKEEIVLGNGSEQLIKLIAQTFLQANDVALIQRGSFGVFTKECLLAEAKVKFFRPDKATDVGNAKLLFICNPNNPTGEVLDPTVIEKIARKASNSIVVIDEAIGEFTKDTFITKALKTKNCLVLRTFSKAFGLAGIRIGFATGSENLINKLDVVQQSFPVSEVACKLALSALEDEVFLNKTINFIKKERLFLISELKRRKLCPSGSITNNIFVETPLTDKLIPKLNRLGVSIVPASGFPGMKKPGFRICIKDKKTNRLFISRLDKALSCIRSKNLITSKKI